MKTDLPTNQNESKEQLASIEHGGMAAFSNCGGNTRFRSSHIHFGPHNSLIFVSSEINHYFIWSLLILEPPGEKWVKANIQGSIIGRETSFVTLFLLDDSLEMITATFQHCR